LGGISSDNTYVWVANSGEGIGDPAKPNEIYQVDIASQSQIATITVGLVPSGVSSDGTNVWVSNSESLTVSKITCNNVSNIKVLILNKKIKKIYNSNKKTEESFCIYFSQLH
jgi:DNA-binding beta-propeller fold protein YncE